MRRIRYFLVGCLVISSTALLACDDSEGNGTPDPPDMHEPDTRAPRLLDAKVLDSTLPDDMNVDPPDMGADLGPELPCDPISGFGLIQSIVPLFDDSPQYAARLLWNGTEYASIWQTSSAESALNQVYFGRFDADGVPLGEPLLIGTAKLPQHLLLDTGDGYLAVWIHARSDMENFDGVRIQRIDADGQPTGDLVSIDRTFDVTQLSGGWATGTGGMLAYIRSREGVTVLPLDLDNQPGNPVEVTSASAQAVAISYGDGSWGLTWLDRTVENPADLAFVVINDGGHPISEIRQRSTEAQGGLHIAYGSGVFGVAWSKVGPMGLKPQITLFDASGDQLANPPLTGVQGSGTITDVAWLNPDNFGVVWQDSFEGTSAVGVTRVNTGGQVLGHVRLASKMGESYQGLTMAGNVSRAGAVLTIDPNAPLGGGYSASAQLHFTRFGQCR